MHVHRGRPVRPAGGLHHPELGPGLLPAARTALDQPSFSFWADQEVVERILGEGDSWALSKSPAFEKRDLPPAWKYHDAA